MDLMAALAACQDRKREGDLLFGRGSVEEAERVYRDAAAPLDDSSAAAPGACARLGTPACVRDEGSWWHPAADTRRAPRSCLWQTLVLAGTLRGRWRS